MIENGKKENGLDKTQTKRKALIRMIFITIMIALCLFLSAGTIAWWNGWVFLGSYVLVLLTLTGLVFRSSPELVKERMNAAPKAKSWDKVIVPFLAMILPLLAVIVSGLDHRFGWTTSIKLTAMITALIAMLLGNGLTIWAMRVNPFFSSHVRIQSDRGHSVISNGPYRLVRHPGYTGSIIYNLGGPILLGSYPALWIGIAFTILMIIRTALEDTTLRKELAGYSEYAAKVRWRLIPFIW